MLFTWPWKNTSPSTQAVPPPTTAGGALFPPDTAWLQGFTTGFSKAWDMMVPLMLEGVQKTRHAVRQAALQAALDTVNPAIQERAEALVGNVRRLRQYEVVQQKREEFVRKRDAAPPEAQEKYRHYIEALDWLLNVKDTNGHPPRS